jgi:phenylpropionate dioxygenase-like ring-hydroxylating dioxygenase large terminal subunit
MAFLKNCWYLAAWSEEVANGLPFARTLAGEPIVLYRVREQVVALLDRCPHRFAPLSLGSVEDGNIRCAYHGIAFGPDGRCIANPHGIAPRSVRTSAYPVVERHSAVWIWMGKPSFADPGLIPDLSFIDAVPPKTLVKGLIPTAANYLLVADNIMDLTHADSLHPSTLGGGSISKVKPEVFEDSRGVTIRWSVHNELPPPGIDRFMPKPGTPADAVRESYMVIPAVTKLTGSFIPVGRPAEEGIRLVTAHAMTPETEFSTHYFYCNTRNYGLEDEDLTRQMTELTNLAFAGEDKPMIEAQQKRMGTLDFWSLKPALIGSDKGSIAFRRLLARHIAKET